MKSGTLFYEANGSSAFLKLEAEIITENSFSHLKTHVRKTF